MFIPHNGIDVTSRHGYKRIDARSTSARNSFESNSFSKYKTYTATTIEDIGVPFCFGVFHKHFARHFYYYFKHRHSTSNRLCHNVYSSRMWWLWIVTLFNVDVFFAKYVQWLNLDRHRFKNIYEGHFILWTKIFI